MSASELYGKFDDVEDHLEDEEDATPPYEVAFLPSIAIAIWAFESGFLENAEQAANLRELIERRSDIFFFGEALSWVLYYNSFSSDIWPFLRYIHTAGIFAYLVEQSRIGNSQDVFDGLRLDAAVSLVSMIREAYVTWQKLRV